MLESSQSDLGMTRSFRRKLVSVGFTAWLVTLTGLFALPDSLGGFLLVPGSASLVCWLFLLSYALYDVGLFKRHPDERQREVRNRVYSTSYRLIGVLGVCPLRFVLSGTNRTFRRWLGYTWERRSICRRSPRVLGHLAGSSSGVARARPGGGRMTRLNTRRNRRLYVTLYALALVFLYPSFYTKTWVR